MSGPQALLAHANKIALLALLLGIVWRGRFGHCWSFSTYVVATLLGNVLASVWPERFFTPSFWMQKQAVYDVLKAAIALELSYRALVVFPGAWRRARVALTGVLVVTTLVLAWLTPRASYRAALAAEPSIVTATVWLFVATGLVVTWYHLPIGRWSRVIMLGFAAYLLTFATLVGMLERQGWTFEWVGRWDSAAWLGLVTYWAYEAWRREAGPGAQGLGPTAADA
jgi:hypothetical protein